ncbi:glycosyltransferase [Devosia ginsengisoli]|uniref:glycosyltransferase family 2 protein n=1 Tax=Devosia ginsengisoli TaxID=400770 RepID=UPI0026EF0F1B|nr:glycosyltransferase [Devosia ginsengisoli]MCR6672060.1 glycosyltransferase [Devosia ginsengisoli]
MRVTVYILNHNQWQYLDSAIESVFSQTYKNVEIILVDNGSTDVEAQLSRFAAQYAFDRILSRKDTNLKRAANEVLAICEGEYILRLDADDFLHESAIQVMVEKARSQAADYVSTDYFFVNDRGETTSQFYKNSVIDFAKRPDIPMHGACCLIRSDFLRDSGGYNVEILMQDGYDIWLALSGTGKGEHINLPLFSYRRHGKNLSNDSDKLIEARRSLLASHCPAIPAFTLNYFTRAPLSTIVEGIEPLLAFASRSAARPSEVVIFCGGERNAISSIDFPSGTATVVERADPEALEKNAVAQCLMDHHRRSGSEVAYAACIYEMAQYNDAVVSGALRSALTFNADIVHSVRRETMNLFFHDGLGLRPLAENATFTNERSIIFKRYPVCDVYSTEFFSVFGRNPKIGHFLLKSSETTAEVNHGWNVA